jgi:phosphate starvation-inducible PhoH-like protein
VRRFNVIERVILGDPEMIKGWLEMVILVHSVGGKIIKAMTPNQQLLVDTINKNSMVLPLVLLELENIRG